MLQLLDVSGSNDQDGFTALAGYLVKSHLYCFIALRQNKPINN